MKPLKYVQLFEDRLESLKRLAGLGLLDETLLKIIDYIESGSEGNLSLRYLEGLTALPAELKRVGGWLDLQGCTNLQSLPDGLRVEGVLDIRDCRGLQSLPSGLRVEGELDMRWCEGITEIPDDAEIWGDIYLHGSGVQKITDKRRANRGVYGNGFHIPNADDERD